MPEPAPTDGGGTLMEQLSQDRLIRLNSPEYQACRENYRANLMDITATARDAGVPMVLCGLVSNERDIVPMVSAHREGLSPDDLARWKERFEQGTSARLREEWEAALDAFQAAVQIDDTHAETVYWQARCLEALGATDTAREVYRRARDLDALRFRATVEFSRVVRDVAAESGFPFVDTTAVFEAASPEGLIGWNLMTDHVHPTSDGHYLLAKTVCGAMAGYDGGWPAVPTGDIASYDDVAARLGVDDLTKARGKYVLLPLAGRFPYKGTANAGLGSRLERELTEWQVSLTGPMARGVEQWQEARGAMPMHVYVAKAFLDTGDLASAGEYYRRALLQAEPHSQASAEAIAGRARCRLLTASDPEEKQAAQSYAREALRYLDECRLIQPDDASTIEDLNRRVQDALQGDSP
jgi:tetratricopeptide (TPR) repeat protein